jgi:phage-related protein
VGEQLKPIAWIASSQKDLRSFPEEVRVNMGFALYVAQTGGKHDAAKVLKGFGSAGVLEVVDDFDGDTFRAVYTVKFSDAVYVLHAFQKKSRKGAQTPQKDVELIKRRLKLAEQQHRAAQGGKP